MRAVNVQAKDPGARRLRAHAAILVTVVATTMLRAVTLHHRVGGIAVLVLTVASVDGVTGVVTLPYSLFDRGSFVLPVSMERWGAGSPQETI
jgi:hypothetical protein